MEAPDPRLDMPACGNLQTSDHLNTSQLLYGKVEGPTFHGYWYGGGSRVRSGKGGVNPMYNVFNFDWQVPQTLPPLSSLRGPFEHVD